MDVFAEVTVDMNDKMNYDPIFAKQYDRGRKIIVKVLNKGKEVDTSRYLISNFQIKFNKPFKGFEHNYAEKINEDGRLVFSLTDTMLSCAGNCEFEIVYVNEEEGLLISSSKVPVHIQKSAIQLQDFEQTNELNVLNKILLSVESSKETINSMEILYNELSVLKTSLENMLIKDTSRYNEIFSILGDDSAILSVSGMTIVTRGD